MSKKTCDLITVRQSLGRIACALDQPVAAFLDEGGSALREAETLALLRAFDLISGRQARARCIAFVEAEAGKKSDLDR